MICKVELIHLLSVTLLSLLSMYDKQVAVCCSSAEDQDSSGEGLGSNWWVLGSQGCQLSTSGDATLQTLPQPTISPAGSQNVSNKIEEVSVSHAEHNKNIKQECTKSQDESLQNETQREQSERDEGNSHKNAGIEEETKEDSSEEGINKRQ